MLAQLAAGSLRPAAIADMYLLLAALLRLPTREMLEGISNGTVTESIRQMVKEIGFGEGERAQVQGALNTLNTHIEKNLLSFNEVRSEYTRLFDHPDMPTVHRFESVFRHFEAHPELTTYEGAPRLFISPAALDAERCYKQAGFTRSPDLNEPADNMATELEFMSNLYAAKAKAHEEQDVNAYAQADECLTEFTRVHLHKWAIPFFEKCVQKSRNPVYRAVGLVGAAFMTEML